MAKKKSAAKTNSLPDSKPKPSKQVPKFPRVTLEDALRIPTAIKEHNGGNPWATAEVATAVGLAPKANNFFYLAGGARDYGLTEGSRDTERIGLTQLGKDVVYAPDANMEHQKKQEAFFRIEIFKKVLEYYKGSDLPEMKYLGNALQQEFGLPSDTHEEFSRLFRENCTYLGIKSGFATPSKGKSAPAEPSAPGPATVTLAEPAKGKGPVAFIIMPFQERDDSHAEGFFQEVLRSLLTPAASEAGFTVRTANRQGSDLLSPAYHSDRFACRQKERTRGGRRRMRRRARRA